MYDFQWESQIGIQPGQHGIQDFPYLPTILSWDKGFNEKSSLQYFKT